MELTKTERLVLYNQFKILEKLYPEEAQSYANAGEIVSSGYTRLYAEVAKFIQEEMSLEACGEVTDILDMYRALHSVSGESFPGFDGNDESEQYAYARFMIEDQKRWIEFANHSLNSHTPMLPAYRKMLHAWESSANKRLLTKEDVARILQAGGYR